MDERLAAMQREIDTTKAQNRLLATRLRQVAAAYRTTASRTPLGGLGVRSFGGTGDLGGLGATPSLRPFSHGVGRGPGAGMPAGGAPVLTRNSTPREVAAALSGRRTGAGIRRTGDRDSVYRDAGERAGARAVSPNGLWKNIFQQDSSYLGAGPEYGDFGVFQPAGRQGRPGFAGYLEVDFLAAAGAWGGLRGGGVAQGRRGYLVRDSRPAHVSDAAVPRLTT